MHYAENVISIVSSTLPYLIAMDRNYFLINSFKVNMSSGNAIGIKEENKEENVAIDLMGHSVRYAYH